MPEKGTIAVRCPTSGKMNILTKADFKDKKVIQFSCGYCEEKHTAHLDEDFSQAVARIVRQATESEQK